MEMIHAIFETFPLSHELHHSRLIEFSSHEILFHLPPLKSHDPITVEHPICIPAIYAGRSTVTRLHTTKQNLSVKNSQDL